MVLISLRWLCCYKYVTNLALVIQSVFTDLKTSSNCLGISKSDSVRTDVFNTHDIAQDSKAHQIEQNEYITYC